MSITSKYARRNEHSIDAGLKSTLTITQGSIQRKENSNTGTTLFKWTGETFFTLLKELS
jgi:hypothetical protein